MGLAGQVAFAIASRHFSHFSPYPLYEVRSHEGRGRPNRSVILIGSVYQESHLWVFRKGEKSNETS